MIIAKYSFEAVEKIIGLLNENKISALAVYKEGSRPSGNNILFDYILIDSMTSEAAKERHDPGIIIANRIKAISILRTLQQNMAQGREPIVFSLQYNLLKPTERTLQYKISYPNQASPAESVNNEYENVDMAKRAVESLKYATTSLGGHDVAIPLYVKVPKDKGGRQKYVQAKLGDLIKILDDAFRAGDEL